MALLFDAPNKVKNKEEEIDSGENIMNLFEQNEKAKRKNRRKRKKPSKTKMKEIKRSKRKKLKQKILEKRNEGKKKIFPRDRNVDQDPLYSRGLKEKV